MLWGTLRRLRRRIAVKLTLTLVGFVAVTSLGAGLYLDRVLTGLVVEGLESRLEATARLLHDEALGLLRPGATAGAAVAFAARAAGATGARVTLIAPDGEVRADSERPGERLPPHAVRPEVQAALAGRRGRDLRESETVGAPLLYVAVPVGEGGRTVGVLRLAVPLAAVTASTSRIREVMAAGGIVALAVALGIGLVVARRVTRPVVEMQAIARRMSEGDFGARAPVRSPDEIGMLGRSLNVLAARLREKIRDLAEEQARARAILDGMVEGVVAVDAADRVLLMNERARALLGVGPLRGTPRPFLEVVRNADLHAVLRASRALGEGDQMRREVTLLAPAPRVLQVQAVPLRLGGAGAGVVLVLYDVTELRRLEQARTEFVANVSHELRTPLTAIHGYLETLLEGALEDPAHARPFLEVAHRHTARMGRLIDDLTDLSNIELGRVRLQRVPVDLSGAVDAVLAVVSAQAAAAGVEATAEIPPDLPPVSVDLDRLTQILINLLDNAVKYTPPGGSAQVRAAVLPDRRVEVAVADTGIGIPPADLPRVTERFYRVDKARSRELGGTGLGLAIVKHLVMAHGGDLRIESEPGKGTTVRFTLPVAGPAAPA
jgi:two-component system phosphate regulon sensor histidine kinase PhoR